MDIFWNYTFCFTDMVYMNVCSFIQGLCKGIDEDLVKGTISQARLIHKV